MAKTRFEIRDVVHGFIYHDSLEKRIVDSAPFQRLRSIHQLAMCYQVYPGATHRRFEHSLGVMDVAGRIFDVLFSNQNSLQAAVRDRIAEQLTPDEKGYWRRVVRLAGLLHDVGHLPFSHAAEKEILPPGWGHEAISADIIRHSEIAQILSESRPPIDVEDVINVACEEEARKVKVLSPWQVILNEIITGRTFGADRMDYLLRDSYHTGVAYGRFDPDRLINGLCLVIPPETDEIALALEAGSIQSAEALLLARYFMYSQVYFHKTRRAYDKHLKDFFAAFLTTNVASPTWYRWDEIRNLTDDEVLAALRCALNDPDHPQHTLASRLMGRGHFRVAFRLDSQDYQECPTLLEEVFQEAVQHFGADNVRCDSYGPKTESNDFPVRMDEGAGSEVRSSLQVSGVIKTIPAFLIGYVFVCPALIEAAKPHLREFATARLARARVEAATEATTEGGVDK